MSKETKKPVLELLGHDGNAYAILSKARIIAVRSDNILNWIKIREEATSGDYDHLLQTMMKYFDVI